MRAVVNEFMSWIWNMFIWGGIAYYVFERGESGWWFLFPLVLTASRREKDKE